MIYVLLAGYVLCFIIAIIQGTIVALLLWSLPLFVAAIALVVVSAIEYCRYSKWRRQNGFK